MKAGTLAFCLAFPLTVAADELGRISARLGDTEKAWHTITIDRAQGRVATASIRLGGRLTELHLQGHPEPRFTSHDVFSLDLRYLGPYAPGATPMSLEILYLPAGMAGPFWTSNGATVPPMIEITTLDVWGGLGRFEAVFAGELCRREIISSAVDPNTCRDVTGRIETDLFVE